MAAIDVLSIDLGASNGRGVIGSFDGTRLKLQEVHRFANGPVAVFSHLYWDIMHLYKETLNCMSAADRISPNVAAIGIDGWSQDFGILDKQGHLLGMPHHYRDPRTDNIPEQAYGTMSESELFAITGKAPSRVCTLFQLIAMQEREQAALANGHHLLFMPNLLGYYLTGEINCDVTLAGASTLYDARKRNWSGEILSRFGLPSLMPDIGRPGCTAGFVREDVKRNAGISGKSPTIPLISVAQHDTISAILAVEAKNRRNIAYISCGTWSVVGMTVQNPIIDDRLFEGRLCNEPGYYEGMSFIVKYMTGLWILQECIREWGVAGASFDYERVQQDAATIGFDSAIDVEDERFASPGGMLGKVTQHCRETGQSVPNDVTQVFMCIMKGLALQYVKSIRSLVMLTNMPVSEIHIVGGGSRNAYLCKLTAQLSGIAVVAGPHEASVVGNAIVQLIALGEIGGIKEASQVMRQSFETSTFYP